MKFEYPMDVEWGTMEIKYTVSLSGNQDFIDAKSHQNGATYRSTATRSSFERLIEEGKVKIIKQAKAEGISLEVKIEGLEKAVALAKELEEVLGRLKIVVN